MADENMKLWRSVERTDPAQTKKITGKSYKGDSPKPHWIIMRATETFGPCGIGWGFSIDERVENGAMIEPGHFERMHIAKVKVWYEWDGKRGEVEHIGGTPFCGKRSDGRTFTDEDSAKKSVTDALVKALSMIGFAGDIFLGRYDDSKYVQDTREEFREADTAASSDALYMKQALANIDKFDNEAALVDWYTAEKETRQRMLDTEQVGELFRKFQAKRKALRPVATASEAA